MVNPAGSNPIRNPIDNSGNTRSLIFQVESLDNSTPLLILNSLNKIALEKFNRPFDPIAFPMMITARITRILEEFLTGRLAWEILKWAFSIDDYGCRILHGIVLAGGYGKRMGPIAEDLPKPLLPITNHHSALDVIVDKLREVNVGRIFISTNLKFENHFRAWVTAAGVGDVDVIVEPSTSEKNKLGAVRALSVLVSQLPVDDYLILAGDSIFNGSLRGMISLYERLRKPIVVVVSAGNEEQVRRGSVVTLGSKMKILDFEEKPAHPTSLLIGVAIYLMPYQTLASTRQYIAEGGRNDEPGHFISWLCKREDVYAYRLKGRLWDIGSVEEYEKTRREFSDSQRV